MINNKLPSVAEGSEKLWGALFSVISRTGNSEDIYALFETSPIKDDIFQGLAMDASGRVTKIDRHVADRFVLYVKSGKKGKARCNYFGNGERVRDEQSQTGFGYSPETTRKLRHEVGLRLSRLHGLDHKVYFTSKFLEVEEQEVTPEFIAGLLSSGRKELGFVETRILED